MNTLKEFSNYYIQAQENLNEDQKNNLLTYIETASDIEVKALLLSGSKHKVTEEETIAVDKIFELSMTKISNSIPTNLVNEVNVASIIDKIATAYAKHKVPSTIANFKWPSWIPSIGGSQMTIGSGKGANTAFNAAYDKAEHAAKLGGTIGASILVVMVALAAKKAYTSYLSKAARACRGLSGDKKNNCFQKFYVDAVKIEISELEAGKGACAATENPSKCKFNLDVKIKKKQRKMEKIIQKMR